MSVVALMGWDADAKVWRRVLVNAAGKLIIDPSEIFENDPTDNEHGKAPDSDWAFDHEADPAAHHAKYTDLEARTACKLNGDLYWSCPGSYFDAQHPDIDDIVKVTIGYLIMSTDGTPAVCGVFLPDGAVIKAAMVRGNAGAKDERWYLRRITLATRVSEVLAVGYINTEDTTIANADVDNSLYAYLLCIDPMMTSDEIWGARVKFTL